MDPQPASPRTVLDLMTEQELARRLKICRADSWGMAGLIPYYKIGRAVRFTKAELDAALERMRMG